MNNSEGIWGNIRFLEVISIYTQPIGVEYITQIADIWGNTSQTRRHDTWQSKLSPPRIGFM